MSATPQDSVGGGIPSAENPGQELIDLGIAAATGGNKKAKFDYPGGYTATFNNELGQKMEAIFNGQIDIHVKPAPAA